MTTIGATVGRLLGCGVNEAFIQCRGGGELEYLPYTSLSYSRRVDDMSGASLTLGQKSLTSLSPAVQAQCCGLIADIEPWEHELVIFRDGELAWCGPIIVVEWGFDSVQIEAHDLFQWFERRILDRDRSFVGVDLADIFTTLASDALHHDPTPNILYSATPTGILGDREVLADAYRRGADELRELLRSGLDMTAIGRTLVLGGTEIPTADLGILVTEDFDKPKLRRDGGECETESFVIGARPDRVSSPVVGQSGGVDPDRGLVQGLITENGVADATSATAAADSRQALLNLSPEYLTGRLVASAGVQFADLIPGARADLRVQLMCRTVMGVQRLKDVDVRASDGKEEVNVSFSTLGTIEEII